MENDIRRWMNVCEAITVRAYHGTQRDFHAFDLTKVGSSNPALSQMGEEVKETGAIWAAENPQVANHFAGGDLHGRAPDGAQIMPLRVHMDNPMMVDMKVMGPRMSNDWFNHPDGKIWNISIDKDYLVKLAKDRGHDGVVFHNGYDGFMVTGDIYAVFSPTQVKMLNQESIRYWLTVL